MATAYKIVFVRHGESTWNQENRFTGWTDVDLSEQGVREAKRAGEVLAKEGYVFDVAFTSVLHREEIAIPAHEFVPQANRRAEATSIRGEIYSRCDHLSHCEALDH